MTDHAAGLPVVKNPRAKTTAASCARRKSRVRDSARQDERVVVRCRGVAGGRVDREGSAFSRSLSA